MIRVIVGRALRWFIRAADRADADYSRQLQRAAMADRLLHPDIAKPFWQPALAPPPDIGGLAKKSI